jgi:hypothetical protein
MRAYLDSHRDWLCAERLPAYAPELNAVDICGPTARAWSWRICPPPPWPRFRRYRTGIQRVCKHPDLVVGFLAHTGLALDP